jgi:hypothetical protein
MGAGNTPQLAQYCRNPLILQAFSRRNLSDKVRGFGCR